MAGISIAPPFLTLTDDRDGEPLELAAGAIVWIRPGLAQHGDAPSGSHIMLASGEQKHVAERPGHIKLAVRKALGL